MISSPLLHIFLIHKLQLIALISPPSYLLTSPHLILPHHHLTSPHLTLPHLTSSHLISPYLNSPHLTSPSPYLTAPHLTLPYLTSPHLISPYLNSPHLTLPYFTSPHPHYSPGIRELMLVRTSKRFHISRLTPAVENKVQFIINKVSVRVQTVSVCFTALCDAYGRFTVIFPILIRRKIITL